MPDKAEIFWSGGSQAVRLPEGYRFEGEAVRIARDGDRIYLEAIDSDDYSRGYSVEELRALIQEGIDSGPDERWDPEEIKRFARGHR